MSHVFLQPGHSPQRPDWLADDAVSCEPVSAPNSLLTGKLTGNFAKSGLSVAISCPINARIQCLTAVLTMQQNREFSNAYQGIFFGEQGNLIKQQRDAVIAVRRPERPLSLPASSRAPSIIISRARRPNHVLPSA